VFFKENSHLHVISAEQTAQFIQAMPKVELHLHLEGAIPHDTLLGFIKQKGTEPSIQNIDDLRRKLTYTDFANFIQLWTWKNTFITSANDFEQITYDVLRDLHEQNVRYAELTYSPGDYWRWGAPSEIKGFPTDKITECIIAGKQRAYEDYGIKSELIVDLIRDHGPQIGMQRIEELTPYLGKGLVGITIGGSEQHYPPEPYAEAYARAKELGYRLSAHAGEVAGAESIWGAVRALSVERIGHGLRANEDAGLVAYLKEKRIPLEMCPLSNVKTGVCESIESHPIKEYYEQGLMITVSSDDPSVFGNSITEEYLVLVEQLGFSLDDLKQISMNSIDASFMPDSAKIEMKALFEKEWEQLG